MHLPVHSSTAIICLIWEYFAYNLNESHNESWLAIVSCPFAIDYEYYEFLGWEPELEQ